ncbi:MAG: thermosome subunit beta [Candidatus Thermoplasmatota archaeon]|nr:thermosome subunit beta [Candidatus Thermoplasmatota archaeon]
MMPTGQQIPILILKEGTKRERGRSAQLNNIAAAKAIADAVRSTLGPRGMDKMLVDSMGDIVITNDGVTILKEIDVEHPAAKMLVEVAKTQDQECGDGTTTAVIIAGELLKKAEELLAQNIHPTVIASGYRLASQKACEILDKLAEKVSSKDVETLKNIAITSIMSKSASAVRAKLANLAVEAVLKIIKKRAGKLVADIDNVLVVKKHGGSMEDTQIIDGIIIDKEIAHGNMPKRVEKAKIALLDNAIEIKKTEIDSSIKITSPEQLQAFLKQEQETLKKMVDTIKASGANTVICQKGIDDLAQYYLAKNNILAVKQVKESDIKKLAKATGAKLVGRINELTKEDLGEAELVYEQKIGEDKLTFVTGCKNAKSVSVLIRGGTEHVVEEAERAVHDALSVVACALEDGRIVTGAGATAAELALALRGYSSTVSGREQLAINSFADALEIVPRTLAENAGMDSIDTLLELRKAHKKGEVNVGVNVLKGEVSNMHAGNVLEPLRVIRQAILSATDAAVMILRIDDVIASKKIAPPAPPTPKMEEY